MGGLGVVPNLLGWMSDMSQGLSELLAYVAGMVGAPPIDTGAASSRRSPGQMHRMTDDPCWGRCIVASSTSKPPPPEVNGEGGLAGSPRPAGTVVELSKGDPMLYLLAILGIYHLMMRTAIRLIRPLVWAAVLAAAATLLEGG